MAAFSQFAAMRGFPQTEPASLAESAAESSKDMRALLGVALPDNEEAPSSASAPLLSSRVSVGGESVCAEIHKQKMAKYKAPKAGIMWAGRLSPAAEAKVRGEIGFVTVGHIWAVRPVYSQ